VRNARAAGCAPRWKYLLDLTRPPYPSTFQAGSGAAGAHNHRDFFWPAVLKTWRTLEKINAGEADFASLIARVDPLAAFAQRPPSNWAAVWLVGEWARMRAGLSPFSLEQFDTWLGAFFQGHILLEQGLYQEPGHPNSYDLFTRLHLADILNDGYAGAWLAQMQALLRSGLRRSLAVQLSDGTLPTAHRSSGQSWTDGAQVAFFTQAANFLDTHHNDSDAVLIPAARQAALRAFISLQRWQRPGGAFSPVHNLLPAEMRVGYEAYTADGHYSALALAFLASAIADGFDPSAAPSLQPRPAVTFIEGDPLWRAVLHHGDTSLALNAFPSPHYDAFGISDLTFGPGRCLQLCSSARHLESGQLYNPGLYLRSGPGLSEVRHPTGDAPQLTEPLQVGGAPASLRLAARPRGAWYPYRLDVLLQPDVAEVCEATPGYPAYRSLLVPFVQDAGAGKLTRAVFGPGRLELRMGEEVVRVEWQGEAERALILSTGYANRRGLCSLARIDLAEVGEDLRYTFKKEK
jgi:hypothetical protein